jgi:hypothetical protein
MEREEKKEKTKRIFPLFLEIDLFFQIKIKIFHKKYL